MSSAGPVFERIALIGIGLIGSSVARVAKRDGLANHIAVSARSQESLDTAMRLGIADSVTLNAAEAVRDADMVMVCTPMGTYTDIVAAIDDDLKPGCILTDVGSVKGSAVRDLSVGLPEHVHLIPAPRSPAPSIRARKPASPNCLKAAGALSPAGGALMRRRLRRFGNSGKEPDRMWRSWRLIITIRSWP